ncbi:MAG: hypothetical protein KF744_06705 [Taibaiella sp.]|nr:hypothetical protein [Taibaiella sp.]
MLRCKWIVAASLVLGLGRATAQELFVYSEPASNMPAGSTGLRLSNWIMDEPAANRINYHLIPEIMWGVNRDLMVHAEGFFSNRNGQLVAEGAGVYAKYRFFSRDEVFHHFRMAAFGRVASNNADIHQEAIMTNGHNTGYQVGLVATQLLHKLALSATGYYEYAADNFGKHEIPVGQPRQALNYILSAGKLMLPKHYKSYNQTNLNLMLEVIGQELPETGQRTLDIAPSIQLIFHSQARLDIGYRQELYSNALRTAPNGMLVRFEYLLFKSPFTRKGDA